MTTTRITSDFDFLAGRWDVEHHRLVKPLTGSDEWDVFGGSSTVARTYFDGSISIDEIALPERGFSGLSLRLFSPRTRDWTIYWVNSRDGILQPPVRGRWEDGVSRLRGDEELYDGQRVHVTYEWSDVTDTTARWQQAFSADGGRTWETNWVMNFTRTSSEPDDRPDDVAHLPKVTGDFDFLTGHWTIRNKRLKERLTGCDEWEEFENTLVGRTHFNGGISVDDCTFPTRGFQGMTFRTFDVAAREWSIHWIDSRSVELGTPVRGGFENGVGEFFGDDEHEGTPVRVRFLWKVLSPGTAHWEQAFSTNNGQTWETNWLMEETRTA